MGLTHEDIIAKAVEQYKILKKELPNEEIDRFSYIKGYLQGYYRCEDDNISHDADNIELGDDIKYSKITQNNNVVKLLIRRDRIEKEIQQLDDMVLIKYELEKLSEP